MKLSLDRLTAQVEKAAFLAEYWEKDSLLSAIPPNEAEALITLAQVEELANSLSQAKGEWLRLIKEDKALPEQAYATAEGLTNLAKVRTAYRTGHTIQLSRIHKRAPRVGALCRALEQDFLGCGVDLKDRIGAHVYMTPPHSRGLGIHCDYQDVFVLQVGGSKSWKVWRSGERFPIQQAANHPQADDLPDLKMQVVLNKGDVLYVPRGTYHEAWTEDTFSLHISLSVYPTTHGDVLQGLMAKCESLWTAIPTRGDLEDQIQSRSVKAAIAEILGRLLNEASVENELRTLRERSLEHLDPLPGESISDWQEYDAPDNLVLRRTSTPLLYTTRDGMPALKWRDGLICGGPTSGSAFRTVASREQLRVQDLALSPSSRYALAKELVKAGLFIPEPCTPTAAQNDERDRII